MIIIEIKLIIIRSRITLTQRTPLPSVWRHQFPAPLPRCQTTGEDNIIIRSFVGQDCSLLSYYDHLHDVATIVIMILVITGQRLQRLTTMDNNYLTQENHGGVGLSWTACAGQDYRLKIVNCSHRLSLYPIWSLHCILCHSLSHSLTHSLNLH